MQVRVSVEIAKRLRIMQLLLLHGADLHACSPRRKVTGNRPSKWEPGYTCDNTIGYNRVEVCIFMCIDLG